MPTSLQVVQQVTRLVFNVKEPAFGAQGNGATDDTTAIQAAINAATTNGQLAAPANAPSATGNTGTGSAFTAAQVVEVSYTWVTAHGETSPSPTANVTVAGNGNNVVVTIPAFPSGVVGASVYVGTGSSLAPAFKTSAGTAATLSVAGTVTITAFSTSANLPVPTANTTGGGIVFFPPGVYITQQQTLYSNVWLIGSGYETTVLYLKAGTNADLLRSNGFASLTNTNTTAGIYQCGLRNITLDGNNSNNSAGNCLSIYGFGYTLDGVRVRNAAAVGIYSEWALSSSSPGFDSMEATITNFRVHGCKGDGIDFNGPHDSTFANGVVYANGPGGANTNANIHFGLSANYNCAGTQVYEVHCWGTSAAYAWILDDYVKMVGCIGEGGSTGQCLVRANSVELDMCYFFAGSGVTNTKGIIMGDGTHTNIVNCDILCVVGAVDLGAIDLTNAGAYNRIIIHSHHPTAPSGYVGTLNANTDFQFYEHSDTGNTTNSFRQFLGALKVLPTSTGVDAFNVRTQAGGNGFNVGQAGNVAILTSINTGFGILSKTGGDNSIGQAIIGNSATQSSDLWQLQSNSFAVMAAFDKLGRYYSRAATAPTASMQSGAGTAPPSPVVATNSSDQRGNVTFGTGTSPTTGNQINVNFFRPWPGSIPPIVVIIPTNAATAALQPYVSATTTSAFTVAFGVAPAAGQANTTYAFNYLMIG